MDKTQMLDRIEVLEAERDHYKQLAETDQLTQLPNRRALERRTHARNGWFVMADLNGFKAAQDYHPDGHAYGDRLLQEFAEFLDSSCRAGCEDRVSCRIGGDEFVVWCPTERGAQRIQGKIAFWRSRDGAVGAAAGLGKDLDSADAAMFLSKKKLRRCGFDRVA